LQQGFGWFFREFVIGPEKHILLGESARAVANPFLNRHFTRQMRSGEPRQDEQDARCSQPNKNPFPLRTAQRERTSST
jgi:hypothetical protein